MQDKLIIRFLSRSTNSVLDINLNNIKKDKLLFTFNEYEDLSVELDSDIYSIKMECLSFLENDQYKATDDNMLYLKKGKEYIISKNNNFDIGYRPSQYHIIISDSIGECDCIFEVKYNNQVTIDGMNNIIENINNFINGLTIDFFKSQPINGLFNTTSNDDFCIYEILYKYHSRLSLTCEKIISDLKMNISNKVVSGHYMQKQNLGSIRKNLVKSSDIVYSVKKVQNANNTNNIILKKYLTKILNVIEKYKMDLIPIISVKEAERLKILRELSFERENLNKKNAHFNQIIIENHIKSLETDSKIIEKWKNKLLEWSKAYDFACFSIRKLLEIYEIKNLDVNNQIYYSSDFNMNYDYKFIYDLYILLSSNYISNQKRQNIGLFSNRKSYELFEIYGFIILQNVIKELEFQYNGQEKNTIFDFNSGKKFEYINEKKKIIIIYDYYCEKYTNALEETVVNINSKNCKPDYLVLFYEDNYLKNIVVVEMKYRSLKHLVDYEGGSTETDITLEDYFQLGYLRQNGRRPESIVRNVMLLYPSQEEVCFERNFSNYIGLNSELHFNESEAYKTIKKIFYDNL